MYVTYIKIFFITFHHNTSVTYSNVGIYPMLPDTLVVAKGAAAEAAVSVVVRVLQPGQVTLHHALK